MFMGFILSYETAYGITCSDAYWRIKRCNINIEYSTVTEEEPTPTKTYSMSGTLEVFVTKADCVAGKPAIGGGNWMSMPMDMDSTTLSNPIAESYKYLKTQDAYSSAVDA